MWWTQERPGGEHLVTQLLPLMLVRSLEEHAKEADVKRVFGRVAPSFIVFRYFEKTVRKSMVAGRESCLVSA